MTDTTGLTRVLIETPFATGPDQFRPDDPDVTASVAEDLATFVAAYMTEDVLRTDPPSHGKYNPMAHHIHVAYARAAAHDALVNHHEAPFASHLIYTQPDVLDDHDPDQRALGIAAGLTWGETAEKTVIYADLGVTSGMWTGIRHAVDHNRPLEWRWLFPQRWTNTATDEITEGLIKANGGSVTPQDNLVQNQLPTFGWPNFPNTDNTTNHQE